MEGGRDRVLGKVVGDALKGTSEAKTEKNSENQGTLKHKVTERLVMWLNGSRHLLCKPNDLNSILRIHNK